MKKLIGLSGKKGVGKTTAGKMLSEITGYPIYHFADPLKEMCTRLFSLSEDNLYGESKDLVDFFDISDWENTVLSVTSDYFPEYPAIPDEEILNLFSRRVLLPKLWSENSTRGTARLRCSPREIMQSIGTEFSRGLHPTIWVDLAQDEFKRLGALIIPDVRLENEALFIREDNGIVLDLFNPDKEDSRDTHISEAGLPKDLITASINNSGSLEELQNSIELIHEYKILPAVINV